MKRSFENDEGECVDETFDAPPAKKQRVSQQNSKTPALSDKEKEILGFQQTVLSKKATLTKTSTGASNKTEEFSDSGDDSDESDMEHECCICLNKIKFPIQLPCKHEFCFLCLKEVRLQQGTDDTNQVYNLFVFNPIPLTQHNINSLHLSFRQQQNNNNNNNNNSNNNSNNDNNSNSNNNDNNNIINNNMNSNMNNHEEKRDERKESEQNSESNSNNDNNNGSAQVQGSGDGGSFLISSENDNSNSQHANINNGNIGNSNSNSNSNDNSSDNNNGNNSNSNSNSNNNNGSNDNENDNDNRISDLNASNVFIVGNMGDDEREDSDIEQEDDDINDDGGEDDDDDAPLDGQFTCPLCRARTDVKVIDNATMNYNDWINNMTTESANKKKKENNTNNNSNDNMNTSNDNSNDTSTNKDKEKETEKDKDKEKEKEKTNDNNDNDESKKVCVIIWQYSGRRGGWWAYEPSHNRYIEKRYKKWTKRLNKKVTNKKNSKDGDCGNRNGEYTSDVSDNDNDDEDEDDKYNRSNGLNSNQCMIEIGYKDYVIDFGLNIQFAKDDPYRKRNIRRLEQTKDKLERRDSMKGCAGKYFNQKDKK